MSDLQRLEALFIDFGIGYKTENRNENTILSIEAKVHVKVTGYSGFSTEFEFDEKGKFVEASVWE